MAKQPGKGEKPRGKKVVSWIGTVMMLLGLTLLVAMGSAYGYGWYQQRTYEEAAIAHRATLEAMAAVTAAAEATASAQHKTPIPTPTPISMPAVQIEIPAVDIIAKVVESSISDGEWMVPKFAVGHLDGSAMANQHGNGIYYGHVESISSGNVFANLEKVEVGDKIILSTSSGRYVYYVSEKKTVLNNDTRVMEQTTDMRITLITCAGTWNAATHDYSHRLVVVGLFSEGSELTSPATGSLTAAPTSLPSHTSILPTKVVLYPASSPTQAPPR